MQTSPATPVEGDTDARSEQSYSFDIDWKAPNGRTYAGRFTHRCPTVGETVAIEAAHNRRIDGQTLSDAMRDQALMIEHLEVTLKQRPDWAKSIADIPYFELLQAVAEEAAAHLRVFCGTKDGDGAGRAVAQAGGDVA